MQTILNNAEKKIVILKYDFTLYILSVPKNMSIENEFLSYRSDSKFIETISFQDYLFIHYPLSVSSGILPENVELFDMENNDK